MKKKTKKDRREHEVLMGLVDLYIKSGRPIGSNTLKENGFDSLSSATIRNYFSELEKEGLLKQPHISGGRIPTEEAFRLFAGEVAPHPQIDPVIEEKLQEIESLEVKNTSSLLHAAASLLSEATGLATFLSSVRFDHDFISEIKIVAIDHSRCLAIIVTDFGQILTEELNLEKKMSSFTQKRLETYFQWRLKGQLKENRPDNLDPHEEELAAKLYNELMVRYIVRYSNFSDEEIYKAGLSELLAYPEFSDPLALATGLSLFENLSQLRLLLSNCLKNGKLEFWIGEDLKPYSPTASGCSVIAIPYKIGQMNVGAIGVLGPLRMPYGALFGALEYTSERLSKILTKTYQKHKLTFRTPRSGTPYLEKEERKIAEQTTQKLLEIKE